MALLRRIAIGAKSERKEQATRLLNRQDEAKHKKFNQSLKNEVKK